MLFGHMRISRSLLEYSRRLLPVVLLWVALLGDQVGANPGLPTNSYDAHIRNLLLAGKVSEALNYVKDLHGRVPAYLNRYAEAFRVDNQKAGQCQEVARAIYSALSKLGSKAEYLAIRANWDHPMFKMADGTEKVMSLNGNHFIVRVEGMVYDAYTGAAGMRLDAYLARIILPPGYKLTTEVVSKP
jgi:hypothetical protein